MKKLLIFCVTALAFTACQVEMNDAETVDATLPNTVAPAELVGDWAAQKPGSPVVYKGEGATGDEYLHLSRNGRNAVLFETLPDGRRAKLTGTIRFDAESTNGRGSFHFLPLAAEDVAEQKSRIASADLATIATITYHYRMDADWLRIEPAGEPTDESRTFKRIQF